MLNFTEGSALHHAYLLLGDRDALLKEVTTFLKARGVAVSGNPDVRTELYETLGIDAARLLKEQASTKALGTERFFIIGFSFITSEAQNALLKLFEEPGEGSFFFLIAPSGTMLLPTLASRLFIFDSTGKTHLTNAEEFLKASYDARLKFVEQFKDSDNETKKSEFLALLNSIEHVLAPKAKEPRVASALSTVLSLKRYVFDRAPSIKMLADYIALTLPRG